MIDSAFREGLIAHVQAAGLPVAEISRRSGVSKFKLDKLMSRKVASTNVEDAVKLARYFGTTVEAMCASSPDPLLQGVISHFHRLPPEEKRTVAAMLEGLSAPRDRTPT